MVLGKNKDAKRFGCISKVKISVRSRSSQHHLVVMLGSFFYGLGGGIGRWEFQILF
jgi:hypothetical protein